MRGDCSRSLQAMAVLRPSAKNEELTQQPRF